MLRRLASLGLAVLLGAFMLALLAAAARQTAAASLPAPAVGNIYPAGSGVCSTTLQACINGTSAGGTITISANTYVTSVTLDKAVSLVGLNTANTTLRALPGQRVITVTGATIGSSTVISGLTFAGGNVSGGACPAGCGGAIQITGSAQPLLQNLVITDSLSQELGGGLYADAGSPLTLVNVTIISNTSAHNSGGGVFAGDALTLTNVSVIHNLAPNGAGGGVRAASSVNVNGGLFEDNHSTNHGGAMRVTGSLAINGGAFLSNTAGVVITTASLLNGGALRADADAFLIGTTLANNSANHDGGGAFFASTVFAFDLNVISNTAAVDGGGLYAVLTATISGVFQHNQATSGRGGGAFSAAALTITDGDFFSNTAATDGGGAYSALDGELDGGTLRLNFAARSGGGFYAQGDLFTAGAKLNSNTATTGGGAFAGGNARIFGTTIQGNQAITDAGGLFVALTATLQSPTFVNNTAVHGNGGGILVGGAAIGGGLYKQNQARNGGGAYISGTANLNGPQFISNTANLSLGGGLFALGPATIDRGVFLSNTAENSPTIATAAGLANEPGPLSIDAPTSGRPGGGGLFTENSVTSTNNLFQGNQATLNGVGGGAVVNGAGTSHSAGDQFIANLAGTFGGGLVADGPMIIQGDVFSSNIAGNVPALDLAGTAYTVANSLFANNIVTGSVAPLVAGINVEAAGPIRLINDTLANAVPAGQPALLSKTGPLFVSNTIVSGYSIAMTGTGITEDYNLFFDNGANAPTASNGGHSLVANPLFVNPAAGDFHISAASPARDTGIDVGLLTDFDGDPRPIGGGFDIGFDEFALRHLFLPFVVR